MLNKTRKENRMELNKLKRTHKEKIANLLEVWPVAAGV